MNDQKENITTNDVLDAIGSNSKIAQNQISISSHKLRNDVLTTSSDLIRKNVEKILIANSEDITNAKKKGLNEVFLDRLNLDRSRIIGISDSIKSLITLPDPLNKILENWTRPNGLEISKKTTPIGVLGIIYESRPNVTADASGLAIKSGNSVILRCGSDSFNSCKIIANLFREALYKNNLPKDIIQIIPTIDRDAVGYMLGMSNYIDVIIPRGGRSLVKRVQEEAKVPVFSHLEGICHIYVDKMADIKKSILVVVNGKMRRTGICGATETLLIHKDIAVSFLPLISSALKIKGCELVGDKETRALIPSIGEAFEEDWKTEYLAPKLSIKIVEDIYDAINHIKRYGSQHTDAIMTEDKVAEDLFISMVDSAIVIINASTQFADGGEFGLGAEIGISTGRLHARGPVGAEQLTSFKYVVHGSGQTRA